MKSSKCVTGAQAPRRGLGALLLALAVIGLAAPTPVLAQGGDADAAYQAAIKLRKGDGVKADPKAAAVEFKRLADAGHVEAACRYAEVLLYDIGDGKDFKVADQYAQKAADNGVSACMVIVGDAYQVGRSGYKKDGALAVEWYLRAADKGNVQGMYEAGEAYGDGKGVPIDRALAVPLLEKAANLGHVSAMYSLGFILVVNDERFKRKEDGLKWLRQAAQSNSFGAQSFLGSVLSFGKYGVEPNLPEGMQWLRTSAEKSKNATMALAEIYRDGLGVPADWGQAVQWADKALTKNHAPAATFIGRLYVKGGPNLRQNLRLGFEHLKRAYGSGDSEALSDLQKVTDYRSGDELLKLADSTFYSMRSTDYYGLKLNSELKFEVTNTDRLYNVGRAKLIVHLELTESGNVAMTLQASTVEVLKPFYVNYVLNGIHKLRDHDNWLTIRTQVLD
jgi:TPR repeat protein